MIVRGLERQLSEIVQLFGKRESVRSNSVSFERMRVKCAIDHQYLLEMKEICLGNGLVCLSSSDEVWRYDLEEKRMMNGSSGTTG